MENKIQKILVELYEMDPSLQEHEVKLRKALQVLMENKVDDNIDQEFLMKLKNDLLAEMSEDQKAVVVNYGKTKMKGLFRWFYAFSAVTAVIVFAVWGFMAWPNTIENGDSGQRGNILLAKVDDWAYEGPVYEDDEFTLGLGSMQKMAAPGGGGWGANMAMESMDMTAGAAMEESLGFSVGGAKDINNFRENIANNYLPIPTDITAEGVFYDYYFDKGELTEECDKLFCPSYSYAISADPISGEDDYYLSVGLNSGMKESDFVRKKLNLVVVLDISGSMSSSFNDYYYDSFGNQIENKTFVEEDRGKSKMEIANESIVALLDHLNAEDRFGMVLFDDAGYLAKPLNLVAETDLSAIKDHILEIQEEGGTNMEAGMELGTELFAELKKINADEYENRIIFLTDAMPNTGDISEDGLMGQMANNADDGIYSSFIGIGVDFNTELIESISKVRGANYYSVHSSADFEKRMDEEFDFMVTPLVFDLELKLEADGFEIEKVYGSPSADESTGEIMKVNTLFPSKSVDGETKGGVILLKLKKVSEDGKLKLITSYKDRNGKEDGQVIELNLEDQAVDSFPNTGIHKAVLLSRYVDLMKNWLVYEHLIDEPYHPMPEPYLYKIGLDDGIICPPIDYIMELGPWERQSMSLRVSGSYKESIEIFRDYFLNEINKISDNSLEQESDLILKLLQAPDGSGNSESEPMSVDGDDWLLK